MVKSSAVSVYVGAEAPQKIAEMDVYGIRAPFTTDAEIMSTIVKVSNDSFIQKGQPGLVTQDPRLRQEIWAFWKCTVDIVETPPPSGKTMGIQYFPSPLILGAAFWLALVILFMGMIIGHLIGKWWTYLVIVRPLEEALQEVVRDINEIIDSKHEALAAGLIDAEFAAELDAKLEEARDKAEEAGEDPRYDWVDYLGKALEYVPWIVGGAVAIAALATIRAFAPRRG